MYHVLMVSNDKLPITWKFGKDNSKRFELITDMSLTIGEKTYVTVEADSDTTFYSSDGKELQTKPCRPKNSLSSNEDVIFYKQVKTVYELIMAVGVRKFANKEAIREILKDYLEAFFTQPIHHRNSFSSYDIWVKLAELLCIMGLKASDLVAQSQIDKFLIEIIRMCEFKMYRMITRLGNRRLIIVSEQVKEQRKKAQRNLDFLIVRAKERISKLSVSDFEKVLIGQGEAEGEFYIHKYNFFMDDEYFGKVKIWVEFNEFIERVTATLIIPAKAFSTNTGATQDITPKRFSKEWWNESIGFTLMVFNA